MAGRGVYRGIHSSLLDDPDFQHLSAHARQVFLTLRLCRDAGPAVIFRYYPEVVARQTGLSANRVETAMVELERPPLRQPPWILREGVVIWIRNGLRHDPNLRLSSSKHRAAVIRQLEGLPRGQIVARFCEYYELHEAINSLSSPEREWPPSSDTEVLPEKDTDSAGIGLPAVVSVDLFEQFYSIYPRKKAPGAARKAWNASVKQAPPEAIIAALTRQLPEFSRRPSDRVPYPATWLNGEQWRNEPSDTTSADPYADWPELYDCATCRGAHGKGEQCTSAGPA